jgi:iron complex outermembrane recepter protein
MRFRKTTMAMAATTVAAAVCGSAAHAQTAAPAGSETEQRVEITGSSIKRIAAEGALPVITLNKADIERSGATSVRELVQSLPAMQGFTVASDSVNGGAGGTTDASLRNLGSIYTLVLLNGRRVAPYNTGSTVNLEQLPLAAIERVEILADGASALYGADAIAGVVNFITKTYSTEGGIDIDVSVPQHAGGKEQRASLSKGFGDIERDGFNVRAGLSFEKVDKITAQQRPFSKSGVIPFEHNGRRLLFSQTSTFASPPNVELVDANGETLDLYSPRKVAGAGCGDDTASLPQGDTCRFDYPATVEAQPEAERKNLYLSGHLKLGADTTAFVETLLSDVSLTGRFAPPAQAARLDVGSTLYERYVTPTLQARGIDPAAVDYGIMYYRLRDAGPRANEFNTKGTHLVVGVEGQALGFDGSVALTHSKNRINTRYAGGYASQLELDRLIEANQFDPFTQGTGAQSPVLASAVLTGPQSDDVSQLDVASFKASRPLFDMGGNQAYLGLGVDLMRQRYAESPSPIGMGANPLQPDYDDFPVGASQGALPFDTTRKSRGSFAELQLPFSKAVELTGSVRWDSFDAASNSRSFDNLGNPTGAVTQGNSASKATYKLGLRIQPSPQWLLRASYGTGFRPATLKNIADPLKEFGVTSSARDCPVTSATDPLAPGCRTLPIQYKMQTGGNPLTGDDGLKPETSRQWTLGMRFEPSASISVGLDLWSVAVKNVVTVVPEDTAFDNFERYRDSFSLTTDASTGRPILTFNQVPVNGASAKSVGVDLDLTARVATPIGRLTGRLMGTYLKESFVDYGFGGGPESSLGRQGSDDLVAFRTLLKLQGTLETGGFANTLTVNWKPGYLDQTFTAADRVIRELNDDGTPGAYVALDDHRIPAYWTLDWQTRWTLSKRFTLMASIKNLLDKEPPLSLKTVAGNMVGFDPRYADGRGRTLQLNAQYRF